MNNELSTSDSYFVQSTLTANPSVPPTLAKIGNASVKTALTRNKATPKSVLKDLASDPDPEVSNAAKGALAR